MARVFNLDTAAEDIRKNLARSFQSANVNFLIGSGASYPATPSAGAVEEEIASLFEAGDDDAAYLKLYSFLTTIQAPTNKLITGVAGRKRHGVSPYLGKVIMPNKCQSRERNGSECKATVQTGKDVCAFHDPDQGQQSC
jgi:hypothetical protein